MIFLAFAENSVQLVPDGTLFLHIALILIMIWVLNRTLFKPINRILAERERKTGGRTGEAGDLLLQADNKLTAYEHSLREARSQGYSLVEKTRSQELAVRQEQIEAVKTEVAEMTAKEKAVLQKQVGTAQKQLQTDAQILAERISANIMKQTA